jgi:hypothetical protein
MLQIYKPITAMPMLPTRVDMARGMYLKKYFHFFQHLGKKRKRRMRVILISQTWPSQNNILRRLYKFITAFDV